MNDKKIYWQCLVKMYSKVCNSARKRNVTSTYICRFATDWTNIHWWTYKHHPSFFSVLLSLSLLLCNPWQSIAFKQDWMLDWAKVNSLGGALSEISVSSAYFWWPQLWQDITSDRGCEYRVNSTGLRTDPWGTPKARGTGVNIKPPTITDCVQTVNHNRLHLIS